jgi:hypothetical protein
MKNVDSGFIHAGLVNSQNMEMNFRHKNIRVLTLIESLIAFISAYIKFDKARIFTIGYYAQNCIAVLNNFLVSAK